MPRGSKPGERRGGRQRGTPNKKTLLRNAELAAIAAKPDLQPLDYFLAVMCNEQLPQSIRVKAAIKALPLMHEKRRAQNANVDSGAVRRPHALPKDGETAPVLTPLDFLLSLLRDPNTPQGIRFKVAAATAPYVHQKKSRLDLDARSAGKPDRYGFAVNVETAKELRDITRRITRLRKERPRDPQQHRKRLERSLARRLALVDTLPYPCPSLYGPKTYAEDMSRYGHFLRKRRSRSTLTREENIEEARIAARMYAYNSSPERKGRDRIDELEQRHRLHKDGGGPRLTLQEQSELRGLRTLYPKELPPPTAAEHDSIPADFYQGLCAIVASELIDEMLPA